MSFSRPVGTLEKNLKKHPCPHCVTSIGIHAFYGTSLTNVTIPDSVTSIGVWAFDHCISLTAIMVDVFNSVYSSVDGVLFNKSKTTLIQYPAGTTTQDRFRLERGSPVVSPGGVLVH